MKNFVATLLLGAFLGFSVTMTVLYIELQMHWILVPADVVKHAGAK